MTRTSNLRFHHLSPLGLCLLGIYTSLIGSYVRGAESVSDSLPKQAGNLALSNLMLGRLEHSLEFSVESVPDTVDYSPNLPGGGHASPQSRSRFLSKNLSSSWTKNNLDYSSSLALSVFDLELASLRNKSNIHQLGIDYTYTRHFPRHGYSMGGNFSIKHSFANRLEKNSFTRIATGTLTNVRIHQPKDIELSIGLNYRKPLPFSLVLQGYTNVGYQKTSFSSISGSARSSQGCLFDFQTQGNGGLISQTQPCGPVQSYTQSYPDNSTLSEQLGVNPIESLRYSSHFLKQGIAISKRINQQTTSMLSLDFGLFRRGQIDDISSVDEHKPVASMRSLKFSVDYQITKRFGFEFDTSYRVAAFLETIPFLYTRYTSDNFKTNSLSFSLTLKYAL